jgi:hypothetical protein
MLTQHPIVSEQVNLREVDGLLTFVTEAPKH